MGSRRAVGALAIALTACAIDVTGTRPEPDAGVTLPDGGAPLPDGGGAPRCAPKETIRERFDGSLDTSRWLAVKNSENGTAPRIGTVGSSRGLLLVDGRGGARGAVYWKTPVPTRALDVRLTYAIAAGQGGGDGMAVVWLDTRDEQKLSDATSGSTMGVPRRVDGRGVEVDLYENGRPYDDPASPHAAILGLRSDANPGDYDWHLGKTGRDLDLVGLGKVLVIKQRRSSGLEVSKASGPLVAVAAGPDFTGMFGVTAACGASTATVALLELEASFYDCDPD